MDHKTFVEQGVTSATAGLNKFIEKIQRNIRDPASVIILQKSPQLSSSLLGESFSLPHESLLTENLILNGRLAVQPEAIEEVLKFHCKDVPPEQVVALQQLIGADFSVFRSLTDIVRALPQSQTIDMRRLVAQITAQTINSQGFAQIQWGRLDTKSIISAIDALVQTGKVSSNLIHPGGEKNRYISYKKQNPNDDIPAIHLESRVLPRLPTPAFGRLLDQLGIGLGIRPRVDIIPQIGKPFQIRCDTCWGEIEGAKLNSHFQLVVPRMGGCGCGQNDATKITYLEE